MMFDKINDAKDLEKIIVFRGIVAKSLPQLEEKREISGNLSGCGGMADAKDSKWRCARRASPSRISQGF